MKKRFQLLLLLPIALVVLLTSCNSIPKEALQLSKESLQLRQLQTRRFETNDEAKILSACAALTQDLGFNLDESETKLGVITASKTRSAVSAAQVTGSILYAALTGVALPTDKDQKMRVCIVTRPSDKDATYIVVRVTFQRVVWNTHGQITKREGLTEPKCIKNFSRNFQKQYF